MTEKKTFVVTIDGPAGSGKTTVSAIIAQKLGLRFLTTGAFYRGLAYYAQIKNLNIQDHGVMAHHSDEKFFQITADCTGTQVFIDGQNVSSELTQESVARIASQISAYPEVRKALLARQQSFNSPPGLVAEGRDCGTVVFPNANVKIFLTASLDERAQRRSTDESASVAEVSKNLASRDNKDRNRAAAPMAKAADAIEIDSSSMSAQDVVMKVLEVIEEKKAKKH